MKIPVAILGATGTVGQRIIKLLNSHPNFKVEELVASDKRIGKSYGEVVNWMDSDPLPTEIANIKLTSYQNIKSNYVLSSLPNEIANSVEMELAKSGHHIISNAASNRMNPNVPLLIPEINKEHLKLIDGQAHSGKIVTNPNCSTIFLALGLYPILNVGKLKHVTVTTLQAISGAGYPGISSLDILGDSVPNIQGEEDKINREIKKIIGTTESSADISITVNVNRIPVVHGHTIVINPHFESPINIEQIKNIFYEYEKMYPMAYRIHDDPFSPRPRRDLCHDDTRAHIGRIKKSDDPNQFSFISMGHNLVRGAAYAAISNLELLHAHLSGYDL